jgi:uncharacterized protein (DUF1778 family)
MSQVNFRLSEEDMMIIKELADEAGLSVAEYSKRIVKENIAPIRLELAFKLLKEGKIHKKKAWMLSGLNYSEFMIEWTKRDAEDIVPDNAEEKGLQFVLSLELKKNRRDVS